MRTLTLAAGTALLGLAIPDWILPGARAALVLDQQYLAYDGVFAGFSNGAGFRRAETFTVGVAGTLTDVDVIVSGVGSFTGINILSTVGGVPTTTIAAAGTFSSQAGDVAAFSVSLPVSIGEVLAIEPLQPIGGADWLANDPDTYAGGGDYFVNPIDGVNTFTASGLADDFRTFVTVASEPDGLAVFGIGLLGLGFGIRHRAR